MAEAGPKLLRGLLEVFVLESLEAQPKHGYALLKEMGETFGAQPNRNRLYPLLAKLVADGYIREVSESGGNRTLYALTDLGRDALHSYRRLPPAFRHALRRIWGHEGHPEGAHAPPHAHAREVPVRVAEDEAPVGADDDAEADADADGPHDDAPYPCPDARVDLRKDPRSGDLQVRLSGCPMGAYDYCPKCPVHKAVQGLRELVF
ncbi:MAG TPA: PadR family transcriptional regulator [Candidatus Thermoplasmatota archaeon]|nr:PadR family transcriptional regulator [Candidatus Thermoplasmatota archaeon]